MNIQAVKRRAGRPSAEEAEQKRRGLIVAALEEFAHVGFHGASLRDIAEKASISSRTLYNYYPDKLKLFEACLEYSNRQIQTILPDMEMELEEALVTYAYAMHENLAAPQVMQISLLIYREGSRFHELRRLARTQFERYQVAPVASILANHDVPREECNKLATQFVAMAFGDWQRRLLFGEREATDVEMADHARLVTQVFLRGINDQWR
jgi:AcrR family transcriptional regulator